MVRCRPLSILLVALLAFALLGLAPSGVAHPGDDHPDPGLHPSFVFFPKHEVVHRGVTDHAEHPWVTLHSLGESPRGREIVLAEVTDPESDVPYNERVVTLIITQQHGNEPAGTPAALQLLDDITAGKPIAETLSNQVLLLLPMANPDGAQAEQRGNSDGVDINRDHIQLATTEAMILHGVLNRWNIHVAMDHHEYGGTGLGNPVPVRLYDYDLTTLYPVHGNVRPSVLAAAQELMYEGLWPAAEKEGYSSNYYGQRTIAGEELDWVAGGPDPGIMRNHIGLHHIAGLLVETLVSVDANPFHDAARRVAIHSNVMEATLTYVSQHTDTFIDAKNAAIKADLETPWAQYLEGDERAAPMAEAYKTALGSGSADIFAAHGLHPGHERGDERIHNIAGEVLAGHAAALLHPESSRQVVDATAAQAIVSTAVLDPDLVREAPAPLMALFALLVLAGAGLRRRSG